VWVPETRQLLRDLRVLVDQAAEPVVSDDCGAWVRGYRWERAKRRSLVQVPVWAVGVEVRQRLILTQHPAPSTRRAELRGVISTKAALNRYLRVTPGGLLRLDAAAVAAEAKLDGKYLLRTSDPNMSAEDIALGYKQLLEVERGWRDMKQILDLRPVYHRLEDRIRAHVLLCWLALLLARIVETRTHATWPRARDELQRLHVGTFTGPAGTFRQTTTPGPETRRLHEALKVALPPKILHLDTEPDTGPARAIGR
jgi:hypothetical protein